jgi:hypothetical protein
VQTGLGGGDFLRAELSLEERKRYSFWWKKFNTLKYTLRIGLLVCFVCYIVSLREHPLTQVARAILYPAFWITCGAGLWWGFLECPRCAAKFSGWWASNTDRWDVSECQECGLSCSELSVIARSTK